MSKKHLYIAVTVVVLGALLIGAWWGWSKAGLAVLELGMGVC
ncbi:MAG: hypothetical protein RBR82_02175 [Pseudomonas sp.]|jgi:hypothetical protein|nr:hypothetical protein [Pseudomonas sp.]